MSCILWIQGFAEPTVVSNLEPHFKRFEFEDGKVSMLVAHLGVENQ